MIEYYMDIAIRTAQMSHATRSKVGGILVSEDHNIISFGWNGTPAGFDNVCEKDGVTVPEVIHCEPNIYAKVASSTQSSRNSILFLTLSPCYECAKLIMQARTKAVVYLEAYRIAEPLDMLHKAGVATAKYADVMTSDWTNFLL